MEKIVDLHMHSSYSDGTVTPVDMIKMMNDLSVDYASITDHDNVKAYEDIRNTKFNLNKPITIIPATELGCSFGGVIRDVLGYGIDTKVIDEFVSERYSKEAKLEKQKRLLVEYKRVFRENGIVFDDGLEVNRGNKSEAFMVMYNSLIKYPENIEKYPFISKITMFFWNYCSNSDSKFFVDESKEYPTIKEGIDLIHKAGGLAFLAHPCMYRIGKLKTLLLINHAMECGVDGIEVLHSQHTFDDKLFLAEVARKYKLYKSGGSDFHGGTKPDISMVKGKGDLIVSYNMIKDWVDKVDKIILK